MFISFTTKKQEEEKKKNAPNALPFILLFNHFFPYTPESSNQHLDDNLVTPPSL